MKIDAKVTGVEAARREMLRAASAPPKALAQVAEDIEDFVAEQAAKHNKTGALVQSIYLRRAGQDYDIGHDGQRAPEALFVHWGTKPHKIEPRKGGKKSVLRWGSGGVFHFAKRVQHPGYRGDPWMTRAAALAPRLFDQHLQALLQQRN